MRDRGRGIEKKLRLHRRVEKKTVKDMQGWQDDGYTLTFAISILNNAQVFYFGVLLFETMTN
jgi:hypothetical protein